MSLNDTYLTREGLRASVEHYSPQDDYTDSELAHMDPDADWPRCVTCGWSPDWSKKPHSVFVAENTYTTLHFVQVDPDDLIENVKPAR